MPWGEKHLTRTWPTGILSEPNQGKRKSQFQVTLDFHKEGGKYPDAAHCSHPIPPMGDEALGSTRDVHNPEAQVH